MLIRSAQAGDLPAVKSLWNAMIRDTTATFTTIQKTDTDLADLLAARPDAFLVADIGGTCAGFIMWGPFRAGPGYAHTAEHSVITARHARGTGRAQGIHVLIAGISAENEGAVAFHRRLGFAKSGQLPQVGRKNGRWIDLILMSRDLDAP